MRRLSNANGGGKVLLQTLIDLATYAGIVKPDRVRFVQVAELMKHVGELMEENYE